MADVIYFSNELTSDGEMRLVRKDKHIDLDPSPVRVDVVIHDSTKPSREYLNTDPTLAAFYEPEEDKR